MLRFKPEHEEFFEAAASRAGQRDVAIAFAVKWPLYDPARATACTLWSRRPSRRTNATT